RKDDIPESEQPPRKRLCLSTLGSRDTWIDLAEAVPEMTPMTLEGVNTRVIELAELHEHDTQDLYALLEDPHDPDFVPEPIYLEYIPLEDEHILPVEEQPLPPVVSPTAESSGYVAESDPKEDLEEYKTEDGPVDYPWTEEMMMTVIHLDMTLMRKMRTRKRRRMST
nr:hypothetical protein [Tanacetum cinerariifolium]